MTDFLDILTNLSFLSLIHIYAVYMSRLAPTGMIFIPCLNGISHNEIESATPEHISAGCNVLLHAMLERAGVASR